MRKSSLQFMGRTLALFFGSIILLMQMYHSVDVNSFGGFVIQSIPVILVYLAAFIAWRRKLPGGFTFLVLGLVYLLIIKSQLSPLGFFVLCAPSALLAVLLLFSFVLRKFRG